MTVRDMNICDDCSLVPYDKGIGVVREWDYDDLDEWDEAEAKGKQERIRLMVTMGAELDDHNCTAQNAPELDFQCDCSCNPGRFEWHRKRRREARR
jgi:hypothetical protein